MSPRAVSGRRLDELTVEAVCNGDLGIDDIRIHPETLERQADRAEDFGNPQLAESLRRGAELARLDDAELMRIYDLLRPGRCSHEELRQAAEQLAEREMPRCAGLVAEAADAYLRSGLTQ